jgi:glycosyltransferase involved in cell wall biosynthesis
MEALRMSVRASVIVPVFQPGPAFDDLIASLDRQTLPATEFEVILCDDGSGEPTGRRLADVARDRPNVRVLTLEHTGWPGTPRNAGIDAAAGDYVYFVDQDDYLFDAALETLCDFADRNASDVVIGKEVGIGRDLPRQIFRRDIPRAVLGKDPLLELLTPHKMFRTSFLRGNGIRFPDGRVRLEDHLFVMEAYFRAETISVLASEPCYAWVKHPGSASSSRIDPDTYFPHLEAVLDLVEAHTEPGALRDRLLRHWYRGKVLKRLAGRRMLRYPDDYRSRFLDIVTPLAQKRFGPGVEAGLALPYRARSALLRAGRRDDLLRLARFETDLECRVAVTSARWSRGGGLDLGIRVSVTHDGVDALAFAPGEQDAGALGVPVASGASSIDGLIASLFDRRRDLRGDRVELFLHDHEAAERLLRSRRADALAPFRVSIDPLKVFGRDDPSRGGRLTATVRRAGWSFEVPVTADPAVLAHAGRSPLLSGRTCELVADADGGVELRRAWPAGRVKDAVGRAVRRARALTRRKLKPPAR